jgi:hypothetical protein
MQEQDPHMVTFPRHFSFKMSFNQEVGWAKDLTAPRYSEQKLHTFLTLAYGLLHPLAALPSKKVPQVPSE